jgi:hypothetical protein
MLLNCAKTQKCHWHIEEETEATTAKDSVCVSSCFKACFRTFIVLFLCQRNVFALELPGADALEQ